MWTNNVFDMKKLNWNSPTDLPSIPTDRCVLHTPPAWTTQWVLDGPSCPLERFGCGFERHDLVRYSAKGYSQYGADGVIGKLFHDLGTTEKYYVEFGTQKDATECNTRRLRETCAWSGLLMDGGNANATINLHTAFITRENIGVLFKRHKVPKHFDLLSVDIDGNDYHVLSAILRAGYRPRVVVVEYNAQLGPEKDLVAKYSPTHRWDMSCYISASITAFYKLARLNGYSIVASMLPDLYWVRDDVLVGKSGKPKVSYAHTNNVTALFYAAARDVGNELMFKPPSKEDITNCLNVFGLRGWDTYYSAEFGVEVMRQSVRASAKAMSW